ncbi:MAG: hypothetical protein AB8B63_18130 [Granulosicoccus sp.]
MPDETQSATVSDKSTSEAVPGVGHDAQPGFMRRYRLPLFLGVVALCLYISSILYILFVRGPLP